VARTGPHKAAKEYQTGTLIPRYYECGGEGMVFGWDIGGGRVAKYGRDVKTGRMRPSCWLGGGNRAIFERKQNRLQARHKKELRDGEADVVKGITWPGPGRQGAWFISGGEGRGA